MTNTNTVNARNVRPCTCLQCKQPIAPGEGYSAPLASNGGRAQYVSITDKEAMDALAEICRLEGIIPAIESAHAMAYAFKKAKEMTMDQSMIVCLSGRGDKDVNTISDYFAGKGYQN